MQTEYVKLLRAAAGMQDRLDVVAARVFEDELRIEFEDPAHSQDEERYITIGLVHKVITVVYCDRENESTGNVDIRIISARVASRTEQTLYNNNLIGRF